jgi:2-isopropylmalate synthase
MTKTVPGHHLGIHAHNDTEQAVANSLAAVDAGVRQIQGTLNGIGERCGNANLVSLIGTLATKKHYRERYEIGVSEERLKDLTHVSRAFDELLNRAPLSQAPYVGKSAFATKAGIHASALAKEPETYEHVPPETVGNRRRVLVSDQSGKSNLIAELTRVGIAVAKDDPRLDHLLREVKEREAQGYAYDGADASFELLARRMLGTVPHYFDVLSFRTSVEQFNGEMHSEAIVKVKVGDDVMINAGEGNGPVNALDVALRKDLGKFQKHIEDMDLVDFKVRILNGGTGATTRVLVESRDGKGERWFTVGVSPNIVEASFQALLDSITYKLVRDGVAA